MAEPGVPEVPGYEVLGILGQGGFGVVYRARQLAVRREVALKIDNRVLVSERDRRRFIREVASAGALSGHPHVADVYDAGLLVDGRPYMVLELCPGGSLADRLRAEGPLDPREVRDIGVHIADALAAAHAGGVLHRDVKPANILINGYGLVALSDFGLATSAHSEGEMSVTRESLTPAFGPPEAFELAEPSPAGDVYSLCATLYALLSGRPPRFPESGVVTIAMIMALHRRPIPEIPGVPPELTGVLRAGMATDRRERISSAAALRELLSALPASTFSGPRDAQARGGPPVAVRRRPPQDGPAPSAAGWSGERAAGPRPGSAAPSPRTPPAIRPYSQGGLYVAVAGVFALLLVIGTAIMLHEDQGSGSTPPVASSVNASSGPSKAFAGLATTTDGCAAAAIAGAACVREAECWNGLVAISGSVTAKRRGCDEAHLWETFAVAPLPLDAPTYDLETLQGHPTVKRICATAVLIQSRHGSATETFAPATWQISVLPPTQEAFSAGARFYRCLGRVTGRDRPGTYFRPLR